MTINFSGVLEQVVFETVDVVAYWFCANKEFGEKRKILRKKLR